MAKSKKILETKPLNINKYKIENPIYQRKTKPSSNKVKATIFTK